jgi:hypothetical protein
MTMSEPEARGPEDDLTADAQVLRYQRPMQKA